MGRACMRSKSSSRDVVAQPAVRRRIVKGVVVVKCFSIRRRSLGVAAVLVAGGVCAPAMGVVPEFQILDLGTLGGTRSEAHALNEQGQVAGWSFDSSGQKRA